MIKKINYTVSSIVFICAELAQDFATAVMAKCAVTLEQEQLFECLDT